MPDREKLIEICRRYDGTPPCDTCKKPIGNCSMCGLERLIDYLIANGVTVRERGRWHLEAHEEHSNYRWNVTAECPYCHSEKKEIWAGFFPGFPKDLAESVSLESAKTVKLSNFCPNCGAKMDGDGNG